jgi:hypothetical protein
VTSFLLPCDSPGVGERGFGPMVIQLVSEPYEYNTILTTIFSKTYGEDMLRCPYKDYSSLNKWQANMDLLSAIYLFVTMHLRQGKKVSILVSGIVNSSPVASIRGLVEAVPIMR